LPRILCTIFFNFCLHAEILIFAVFSLIFDGRMKIIIALDKLFLVKIVLSDFEILSKKLRFLSLKLRALS